jgi:hypothetical protein
MIEQHTSLTSFDESSESEQESDEDYATENKTITDPVFRQNPSITIPTRQRKPRVTVMEVAAMFDAERADYDIQPINTDSVARGVEVKSALSRIIASLNS